MARHCWCHELSVMRGSNQTKKYKNTHKCAKFAIFCWNNQIWPNFNTFGIMGERKWRRGNKIFRGKKSPMAPPLQIIVINVNVALYQKLSIFALKQLFIHWNSYLTPDLTELCIESLYSVYIYGVPFIIT